MGLPSARLSTTVSSLTPSRSYMNVGLWVALSNRQGHFHSHYLRFACTRLQFSLLCSSRRWGWCQIPLPFPLGTVFLILKLKSNKRKLTARFPYLDFAQRLWIPLGNWAIHVDPAAEKRVFETQEIKTPKPLSSRCSTERVKGVYENPNPNRWY